MASPGSPAGSEDVSSTVDQSLQTQPAPKRIRLSLACNQCRRRKVRCDAETPKCRNCWLRGDMCETTDPRKPDTAAVRKWATKDGRLPGDVMAHGYESSGHMLDSLGMSPSDGTSSQHESAGGTPGTRPMSFLFRAYRDHANARPEHAAADISSPDIVMNTDESSHRVKYLGGSSLQCLCIFVDLFLGRKGLGPVSKQFRFGIRHVEELALPIMPNRPDLPPAPLLERCVKSFFARVWPLHPVVDHATIMADITRLMQLQDGVSLSKPNGFGLQTVITHADIASLVTIYCVISIGADEAAGHITDVGTTYLEAAYGLYGHLVSMPYIISVQALLLLCIALRGRCKEGQGWHILGTAIRMSHSMGLHRHISLHDESPSPGPGYKVDLQLHARLWWTCYSLEKLMEMETGRPSAINDYDCDQHLPRHGSAGSQPLDYFGMWVSLSRIMGQISEHIYRKRQPSSYNLLHDTGKLDKALTDWANSLPESIRPGQEGQTIPEDDHQHLAAFLSINYYQAQITLFRASLIFSTQSYNFEIKRYPTSLPSNGRLFQSQNIAIAAARNLVKQVLELADHRVQSMIFTVTQPFLAAVVLALNILKHPQKRMVRSDLELLVEATQYCEDQYRRAGQNPEFVRGLEILRDRVSGVYQSYVSREAAAAAAARVGNNNNAPASRDGVVSHASPSDGVAGSSDNALLSPSSMELPNAQSRDSGFFDPFAGVPLEEFWSMLGTEFLVNDDQPLYQV
ncbi:fungal-specific transcription factor domain-containing protein [Xylariaceae sp. FL0804]|nr:fungal-specific transcription factor domain-containing protein [Xylariaceae sp. FL0804]